VVFEPLDPVVVVLDVSVVVEVTVPLLVDRLMVVPLDEAPPPIVEVTGNVVVKTVPSVVPVEVEMNVVILAAFVMVVVLVNELVVEVEELDEEPDEPVTVAEALQ